MRDAVDAYAPNILLLATPNNPTGNSFDEEAMTAVIGHARSTLVVIDEAYATFAGRSLAHLAETHDNVAIMGTLSKVGLAGARIGYLRLPRALAHEVDKARQPYNLSALAQCVGVLALTELAPVFSAQVARIVAERSRLGVAIGQIPGFVALPSDANFFLVRCEGRGADEVGAALGARGIGVRSFGDVGALAGHVRITVGSPEENDRLLEALAGL
jgi:histidinol-phosphate aminotransferase